MNLMRLLVLILFCFSCGSNVGSEIPIKFPSEKYVMDLDIEKKIQSLGQQIKQVNEKNVLARTREDKKNKLKKRFSELRRSYNRTVSLIRKDYNESQLRSLETNYLITNQIWKYIIANYKI